MGTVGKFVHWHIIQYSLYVLYLEAGTEGVAGDGEVGDLDPRAVVEAPHHAQVVLHPGQVVEMAEHLHHKGDMN